MNIFPINPASVRENDHVLATERSGRVIAITSGKGGVGKTNVTSNLAIALARQGHRVCVFDADTSLANVNIVMGVTPRYTVEHLLSGERSVEEILLEGPEGVVIVPAASGIAELAALDQDSRVRLIAALRTLESSFDYLLIDTAAGIGESVLAFIKSAQYTILVISTEPTSLTDAFALLRVLKRQAYERPAYVLVNMALNYANSMEVFKRFEGAVRKYLGLKVHYLGYITDDKALKNAITHQRPVLLNDPDALASRCFTTLASVLGKQFSAPATPLGFSNWWSDLAETSPLPATPPRTEARILQPEFPAQGGAADARGPHEAEAEAHLPEQAPLTDDISPIGYAAPAASLSPPAPEATASDVQTSPADELDELAMRCRTLISAGGLEADRIQAFIAPLIELCVDRLGRFPLPPERLSRLLTAAELGTEEFSYLIRTLEENFEQRFGSRPDSRRFAAAISAERERILEEYRKVAERLAAQEAELQRALQQICETLDQEPDGDLETGSPGGAGPAGLG